MERLTTTPFGQRPVSAGLLQSLTRVEDRPELPQADKWTVMNDLCVARVMFGITDRDLTVLHALVSFHPSKVLGDNANLIVFPSNAALSARAHGMAESTLRRHLAALCQAGMILRHDSPNGKRYAARDRDGDITRAFGFDLRPLLVRAAEFAQAARATEDAAEAAKRLRETLTLKKRDALKLASYGADAGMPGDWPAILAALMDVHKASRRKQDMDGLRCLLTTVENLLKTIQSMLSETKNMDGSDRHSGRHFQNSNKDSSESEPCLEKKGEGGQSSVNDPTTDRAADLPNIPLALVKKACPDILPYGDGDIHHWHQLIACAATVRAMMGISASAWDTACAAMGPESAAVTVACILQRFSEIRSPGGYLRALAAKADAGKFSIGPMVMALLNTEGSQS